MKLWHLRFLAFLVWSVVFLIGKSWLALVAAVASHLAWALAYETDRGGKQVDKILDETLNEREDQS